MSGLEQAFYIIGIVFMSLMLILTIAIVIAVFVIRAKVMRIQHHIEERIESVTGLATKGGELVAKVGTKLARNAAGKVKKAAKNAR